MITHTKRIGILAANLIVPILVGMMLQGRAANSALAAAPAQATTSTPIANCTPCACQCESTQLSNPGPVGTTNATFQSTLVPVNTPVNPPLDIQQDNPVPVPFLIGGSILLVVLLGVLLYFLVLQPRKKRALLIQAQKLITNNTLESLEEANTLLNRALIAGMSAADVAEARFALGFVRARLEQYADAAAVISDLRESGKADKEILYLDLWLQFKLEKNEAVIRIYEEHQGKLQDLLDAKMIAGMAYLRLAHQCWLRNEVKEALDYYQKVHQLDVKALSESVPENIDDQQVVVGIRSLLDKRVEDARKQFDSAIHAAKEAGRSIIQGRLGLLLCEWKEASGTVDQALETLLQDLEKEIPLVYDPQPSEPTKLLKDQQLLRNVRFWNIMALIISWHQLPPKKGLPEDERAKLNQRLADVRAIDPNMPDAELVDGMISYFFSNSNTEKEASLALLNQYQENGGNLADVLALLEREKTVSELYSQSLDKFLDIVRGYLQNPTVKEDMRQELLARLSLFSRFKQMGAVEIRGSEVNVTPSIEDLQNRSKLIRLRVEKVIRPKLENVDSQAGSAVKVQVQQVDELTKELTENSNKLQKAEYSLLATAGELLLQEETTDAQKAVTTKSKRAPAGPKSREARSPRRKND